MMTEQFAAWILALIAYVQPVPSKSVEIHETPQQVQERYASIASDITTVVLQEEPMFGDGNEGRLRTAALLVALAHFESGFGVHVDRGTGKRSRGDDGRSWCLLQLHVGVGATIEGWKGPELVADRTKCFRAGLSAIKRSFGACGSLPLEQRLSAYASGSCSKGREASTRRVRMGERLRYAKAFPLPTWTNETP